MTPEQARPPLLKQPTFYVVTIAFILFIYAQWPKNSKDTYVTGIAQSQYEADFIKKPKIEHKKDLGLWLYHSKISGLNFAIRFQEASPNLTIQELQAIALESFDKTNETFEHVVSEPTQYEKGYFWSLSDEKGRVRESLWILDQTGWMEVITVYESNKKGHEALAIKMSESIVKKTQSIQ